MSGVHKQYFVLNGWRIFSNCRSRWYNFKLIQSFLIVFLLLFFFNSITYSHLRWVVSCRIFESIRLPQRAINFWWKKLLWFFALLCMEVRMHMFTPLINMKVMVSFDIALTKHLQKRFLYALYDFYSIDAN